MQPTVTALASCSWAHWRGAYRILSAKFTSKTATFIRESSRGAGNGRCFFFPLCFNGTLHPDSRAAENTGTSHLSCALFHSANLTAPKRYRSIDEVTCGDYYEGYFVNSSKSGIGAYTFGTAKAKYIGV